MAQSSSHVSCACLQMPDELSALIQGIVRERVRRNWPLVLAFEIRSGCRELQHGEFVAVMPFIGESALTNAREPLWLGKGAGIVGSGDRSELQCDAHRIQWLQHTTIKGASCWMGSLSYTPVPTSSIVAAGFQLNPIHLPDRCLRSRAPLAFSMPPSVLRMLASACESARARYGAEVRCWILIGASARAARLGLRLRLGLESDLLAESSMFVAESDGCPSQFAFRSQPWHGMLQLRQRMDMAVTERVDRRGGGGEGGARGRRCGGH